ncbi:uncharacterized protein LOC144563315 isoform X2 [Carex rostrata]
MSLIAEIKWRKHAMANTFLTSTWDLLFMMKHRMPTKYHLMSQTNACQAHVETKLEMGQELIRKNGKPLTFIEIERRRKISEAKKGSIAWNKGRKHSEETIQRIRERTREALSDPKVRKKLRGMQGTHSKNVKELISTRLKETWYMRRKNKCYQDRLHKNWAEIIAAIAKIGGYGERELNWNSYYKIREELISEARKKEKEKKKKVRITWGPHSKEVKEQIGRKMKQVWDERKKKQGSDYFSYRLKQKHHQNMLYVNWAAIISDIAKIGGCGERELDWDSYYKKKEELISEAMKEKIDARIKRKMEREKKKMEKNRKDKRLRKGILAMIKEKKAPERGESRRERNGRGKMKMNAKSDRLVKDRLTKLHLWKKRLEVASSSKEIVSDRIGDEWDIEFTKERIGIGISLSDQLQLVKDKRS